MTSNIFCQDLLHGMNKDIALRKSHVRDCLQSWLGLRKITIHLKSKLYRTPFNVLLTATVRLGCTTLPSESTKGEFEYQPVSCALPAV